MGGQVSAFVEVGLESVRQGFRIYSDEVEGYYHGHIPCENASLMVKGRRLDLLIHPAYPADTGHLLGGSSHSVFAAVTAGGKDLAEAVDLEVIVLASVGIHYEELAAAVLELGHVVLGVHRS